MKVLIPEAEVKSYDRCRDTNCIDVTYCLYGQERVITFYEDDIENALDDVEMEGEKYYRIYMIAMDIAVCGRQKARWSWERGL
ncbi:MAG: hypothetical protein ACLTBV_04015 [Enterocloster bolteae]